MSNVLTADKQHQVLALGRLGWSLRRIEAATGVRRETASSYLKAAGVVVRGPGRPAARSAKPAMFAEEKPALGPLPIEPFRYYQYGHRTVHLDGCVEVASAYYGVPPGWIGRRIHVQWNAAHVRLLDPRTG